MRVYNFSPGPSMLPSAVMERAQSEFLDWHGCGMSIMEVSHRGKQFNEVVEKAEADFRQLLLIPDNYSVLFLQGGASGQFSAIPMNLSHLGESADYIATGQWSQKAIAEGKRFISVNQVVDTGAALRAPAQDELTLNSNAAYVHYTPNETITGVEFSYVPQTGGVPLVADFSSTILSRPLDVSQFGVIYAGMQKNIGPAGAAVVIVRTDLLAETKDPRVPTIFDWKTQLDNGSRYNTPPSFPWYLSGLVFEWLLQQGGLPAMAEVNALKSAALYDYIDSSDFYTNPVEATSRSWMNIPFTLANDSLDGAFLQQAELAGLTNLKGHRVIGGMRASIYNAMPMEGVKTLIQFMENFAKQNESK